MFPDPTTITVDGGAKALIRINQDGYSSEYLLKETGAEWRLKIRNSSYKDKTRGGKAVERHNAEFIHKVHPVAPAIYPTIRKVYTVFEMDTGDDTTWMSKVVAGFSAFMTAANATKMLNYES